MAKANREWLLAKAKCAPNNFRFEELCRLAELYGWKLARQEGTSHRIYLHPSLGNAIGALMNFQNRKGQAKRGQIRQLLNAIDELEYDDDEQVSIQHSLE